MKKYVILGHCNTALCMLLEAIQKSNKVEETTIQIVHCDEDMYDMYYGVPYVPFKYNYLKEIPIAEFQPLSLMNGVILIAAMDSNRRSAIFNLFKDQYQIKDNSPNSLANQK